MWIDSKGVCHTIALPDPTALMTPAFRESFDALLTTDSEAVEALIDDESWFVPDFRETGPQAEFVNRTPPTGLLSAAVASVDDLAATIRSVHVQWRLDVVLALEDYLI